MGGTVRDVASQLDGWVTGVEVGRDGAAIITTDVGLVTPSGDEATTDGRVDNLAW